MPTHGTLTLYSDDTAPGSVQIKTQPGNFSLVGEGLNVASTLRWNRSRCSRESELPRLVGVLASASTIHRTGVDP